MNDYTQLDVWVKSRQLANKVYEITGKFPSEELYVLGAQMRRSAISVPSNIAEGLGRNSRKDTLHFLYISRGSLFELETQLYISADQKFISESEFNSVLENIILCKQVLNGFINYFTKLADNELNSTKMNNRK